MNVPDSGAPDANLPDSGTNGDCPTNAAALEGIDQVGGQDVAFARVVFVNGGANVFIVNPGTSVFNFGDASVLCSDDICRQVSGRDDLGAGEETSVFLEDTDADEGEIALFLSDGETVLNYLAWGDDYESVGVITGLTDAGDTTDPLEELAVAEGRWTLGERVGVDVTTNAIFGDGDTDSAAGFTACTGDDFEDL